MSLSLGQQKVNVRTVVDLSKDLKCWVEFFDCLVNEYGLGVNHFVIDLIAPSNFIAGNGGIVPHDHCFVSFVDVSMAESLMLEGSTLDKKDTWEAGNALPDIFHYNRRDDNDILLIALQVLGSEWEDKMVNRRVQATYHDMIR